MTEMQLTQSEQLQDRFGRLIAARLTAATAELPYGIGERLRAARVQAVAVRKPASVRTAASVVASGGSAAMTFGWWSRVGSALPLIVLAAGLILIHSIQNERRASEVAEVDAALLTDELPLSAYADPGFIQFLKSGRD
jgi:hypothetical protein